MKFGTSGLRGLVTDLEGRASALLEHLRGSRQALERFIAPIGSVRAVSDIDGLRLPLSDGRIVHLRPSGNAPEMRCYVEADGEERAARLLKDSLKLVREWAAGTTEKA